jgi:hypothetical protein
MEGLMLRRIAFLLSLAALSAIAMATSAVAQPQPAGAQPPLSGSARLTGRVVAADNGKPVRRAHVGLAGLPESQRNAPTRVTVSRTVETDVDGRFDFADLPAGWYTIDVREASGFAWWAPRKNATLTEGQTVEMTVRLERTGAIEGRIQDERGDGLPGTQVHALRRVTIGDHTAQLTSVGSATTDDRGAFRLFNLRAGEYYVVATSTRSDGPIVADGPPKPVPVSGYANTYYPGSQTLRGARVVVVRSGRDSTRVNFALAPCRLARLSISAVDSRGLPLSRDAQMTLTKRDDANLPSSSRHTSRREDGTFLFDGMQPGDYYLVATTSYQMEEAAYVNVSIHEADVSLKVQTNTGARVSGRILIDGLPVAPSGPPLENVSVSSRPPVGQTGPTYARVPVALVRGTDRFELTGLRGPMVLNADISGGTLLSIQRRGEEVAGKTLEFIGTETIDDIVVALTTHIAKVDVTVTRASSRGEPEPVLVMLFAEDPAQWPRGSRYARTTTAATQLIRVPPGRYLVAAIHDIGLNYPMEAGVLEQLRPLAVPVTVVAGQTAKVTVGVAKAPR